MTTLKNFESPQGRKDAAQAAADYYAQGLRQWENAAATHGVDCAKDRIGQFQGHCVEDAEVEALLGDVNAC